MTGKNVSDRLALIIFLSQSIFSAATVTIFTVISITSVKLSGNESLAGLPSSVLIFTPALTAFLISTLISRSGWRAGLTLTYMSGGIGAGIGVYAILNGLFLPILLSAVFLGIARAGSDLSRYAVGQMFEEKRRATMIGRVVFASAIGAILGPILVPISANLIGKLNISSDSGPWIFAALLYLAASLFILTFLRPDPNKVALKASAPDLKIKNSDSFKSALSLFKLPIVQLATVAMVTSQLVMVVLMVMTPLHIHKLNYGNEVISYVISSHTLGMFAFAALTGYLIDKFGAVRMLFVGAFVLASSVILAPLTNSGIVLAFALFLLGLGWNFGYVAGSSLLSSSLPLAMRSKVQGINDSLIAFIAGTASLGAGPLFALGGYFSLSLAGLSITILFIVLIYYLSIQSKHKTIEI